MKKSVGRKLVILGVILVVIDQVIKVLVKTNMGLGEHIDVIGNWFKIVFIENEGMAFGWAFGGKVGKLLLSVFRICLCAALVWWIRSLCRKNAAARQAGQDAPIPTGVLVGLTLITAGAFGNIIDSLFYGIIWNYAPFLFGKVVDMFYFPLFVIPEWFPLWGGDYFFPAIFNLADSCVTVGIVLALIFYKRIFPENKI
jgi:signal peptidase II